MVPYTHLHDRALLTTEEVAAVSESMAELLAGNRLRLTDEVNTVNGIVTEIDSIRPDIVFIDYIQRVRLGQKTDSRHHEIEGVMYKLKEAAIRYKCHIVALSQINRSGANKPSMEDLKESGSLEEAGDIIMLLHRDNEPGTEEPGPHGLLAVVKNKFGETGRAKLLFDGPHQRFLEEA
jgi:replicative DNA helicase